MTRSTRRTALAAAVLLAALSPRPAAAQQPPSPPPSLGFTAPARSAALAELDGDLRALLRGAGAGARHGVMVVSLDRGDTLFALNPGERMAPASNLKLYSTAAALRYLGPAFRWSTYAVASGEVRGGVLEGDLVVYGTGDPTLDGWRLPGVAGGLEALADAVAATGVREVTGDVVGDGAFFDARMRGDGWTETDVVSWYGAPVASLNAGENLSGPGGRPVADPVRGAASRFRAALLRRGVRVRGGVRASVDPAASPAAFHRPAPGAGPAGRVLAVHLSPPLRDVVSVTNHVSHNLFADALLKTVGRVAAGEGSWEGGARAVLKLLEDETGADPSAVRIEDGSGLSRLDRTTARTTVQLLLAMARGPAAEDFRASLPVAGSAQGLHRMYGTAAAGNLRAKTGTIRGVSSLSGYVTTADGERLAFSIMANDVPETARAKRVEDAVGARLARFTRQ
jgi:D-alanyl-D-alanine carboxypeptidase/D-alanyl-D-alanine-endopeptidase (penicillin-binding protein 4)